MNIVFMGTPDIARKCLKKIIDDGQNEIIGVVTNPDKPKGRGNKMAFSEVKECAIENNFNLYQPLKIRNNEEFISEMKELNPDLFVVVAYGKILPKELLEIPKFGSINLHASLLPKLRGAAPIQWAILNGDKTSGVTTMFMDEGMDTGDIIMQEEIQIGEDETTGELFEQMGDIGSELLVNTIQKIQSASEELGDNFTFDELKAKVGATKQGEDFTIAPMLNKEMSKIDWNKSALEIHNLVRGLNPIMGTYTYLNNKKIKIWKTKLVDYNETKEYNLVNGAPGEIVYCNKKDGLIVSTSNGFIRIIEIQGDNGKKMNIKDFLNGNSIDLGTIFT